MADAPTKYGILTAVDGSPQARDDLSEAMDQPPPLEVRAEVLYPSIVHALVDASKDAQAATVPVIVVRTP